MDMYGWRTTFLLLTVLSVLSAEAITVDEQDPAFQAVERAHSGSVCSQRSAPVTWPLA